MCSRSTLELIYLFFRFICYLIFYQPCFIRIRHFSFKLNRTLDFQKRRRTASNDFSKKKNKARAALISAINPILEKYMSENNIMMIINEKNVILANSKTDLTQTIIDLLNKELKSIKIN